MRTQSICLALAIVLVCRFASAQWVHTNLPDSRLVTSFAVSGTNLFAGLNSGISGQAGGGVFLSTDNGTSWTAVSEGLPRAPWDSTQYAPIYCLGMCGENLFAGTDLGVYVSANNGNSWTAVNAGLPKAPNGFTPTYCLGTSGTNLFAGTYAGVFLSTNNGTSWSPVNTGLTEPRISALAVSGTNLVAANHQSSIFGTYQADSVFFSTNSGTSWTAVNSGLPQGHVVTALAASGTNFLIVMTGVGQGVFLSTNSGASWTAINEGLPYIIINDTIRHYQGLRSCFVTSGTNLFAGTYGDGVFLSTNSGTSWTAVNEGLQKDAYSTTKYVSVNCFASIGQNLFAGTGGDANPGGVWRRPLSEMITHVESSRFLPASFALEQNYP
ncbi:MAG: hypothetical protein EG824_14175, partial [Deltaproteobacteria bacterium]|nr:hypothetical protein [Deltaproteobacteria bacterium]